MKQHLPSPPESPSGALAVPAEAAPLRRWGHLLRRQRLGGEEAPLARGAIRPGDLLLIGFQLALVLAVAYAFEIEAQFGFLRLAPLLLGGFLLHAALPLRWRTAAFVGLSFAAIALVLGAKQGFGLIGLGLGLIGLCHLPVAFGLRVGLVLAAGALLALIRAGMVGTSWISLPTLVLPVLGAMFMFRLALYLYDLRHEAHHAREGKREPATIWERLAYFFMLPNVCFLLFPVVDYQTFRRTRYDADAAAVYQKGVLWMYRGIIHLLLYRFIYHHFVPDPAAVTALGGVVQSMLATYLLYLRVSGQFHLIIGILCLFGFNLPETHHLYYLASSFTDYWRRINIYWKDFMMKLFYYPVFMRLRTRGTTTALVGATLFVFLGTWLLHSYQWFWLRGAFPLRGTDALFWGILGGLVVVNSLLEMKRKRALRKPAKGFDVRAALLLSAKTVGMFALLTVLWSLWSSESLGAFAALVGRASGSSLGEWALLGAGLAGLVGVGVLAQYASSRGWSLSPLAWGAAPARAATLTCLGCVVLLGLGRPEVQARIGSAPAGAIASVQTERLNGQDAEALERNYYEGLLGDQHYTFALWQSRAREPENWGADLWALGAAIYVDHWLQYELVPSQSVVFKEARFETNQWGMRDRDYARAKPPGTFRIALLGSSQTMGWGVSNDEVYEALLEDRLNSSHAGGPHAAYEILNFSVQGYSLLQNVAVLEEKVLPFEPDVVIDVVHLNEGKWISDRLIRRIEKGLPIPYPDLAALIEGAGVGPGLGRAEVERRLQPFMDDLILWGYRRIVETCRAHGIRPVWLYLPRMSEDDDSETLPHLTRLAEEAGFLALSLEGVYNGHAPPSLYVAPWDLHPNAHAHRLIADRLYEVLRDHEVALGLTASAEAPPPPLPTQPAHL